MSVQASAWVIENSQHKGSELLCLLMIANHAHADGTNAFPSIETLARECRMSARQIARILVRLEASGELKIERSGGRLVHRYELQMSPSNPDKMSTLEAVNPDNLSTLTDNSTLTNPPPNPDILSFNPDISGVNPDVAMSYEPITIKNQKKEPSDSAAVRRPRKTRSVKPHKRDERQRDPLSNHPAIRLVKQLTGYYPRRILYDDIIAALGEHPDFPKAKACALEWAKRGYRADNHNWVFDWYVNGIPERNVNGKSSNGSGESTNLKRHRENYERFGRTGAGAPVVPDPDGIPGSVPVRPPDRR